MILTLDIGNSRAKLVLFDKDHVKDHNIVLLEEIPQALDFFLRQYNTIVALHWCTVRDLPPAVESALRCFPFPTHQLLTTSPPTSIRITYRNPATLGADRLAAVLGAQTLCPNRNLLIIDAGTCITYDLLLADGCYLGGNISPGPDLRLKALHRYTDRLPLVSAQGEAPWPGIDTETAIRSGVKLGIHYEIEGYCRKVCEEYGEITIFLTGGHHFDFQISTESCTFAEEFLVARGLAASF